MNNNISREEEKVTIVFNDAELLESFTEDKYSELLLKISDEGKDVELDFSNVEVVDSLFIGGLIILHKKLTAHGKKLIIKNLNDLLADLFNKLNLTSVL